MKLNRTPSLHDRKWRNEENENWGLIEGAINEGAVKKEPYYMHNKGIVFPFVNRGSENNERFDNAILDVQVHYADVNALYKISHISKDNTAWGVALTFFIVQKSVDNGLSWDVIINRNQANLENNQRGIQTHVLSRDAINEVVSVVVDWDELPTGSINLSSSLAPVDYVISQTQYFFRNASNSDTANDLEDNIVVRRNGRNIDIKSKWDDTDNIVVNYKPINNNSFHDISAMAVQTNRYSDTDFRGDELFSSVTDWIGPYGLVAENNPVANNSGTITVGGAHGTVGVTTFPTGRFDGYELIEVDGSEISDGIRKGKELKLIVNHYVSASNAIDRSTGEKRDSIKERRIYTISSRGHEVEVQITALEDVRLTRYAGPQMVQINYFDYFYRHLNAGEGLIPIRSLTSGSQADEKDAQKLDRSVQVAGDKLLVMLPDRSFGIGTGEYINTASGQSPIFFNSSKIYASNLGVQNGDLLVREGETVSYKVGYHFVENQSETEEVFEYEINNVVHTDDLRVM